MTVTRRRRCRAARAPPASVPAVTRRRGVPVTRRRGVPAAVPALAESMPARSPSNASPAPLYTTAPQPHRYSTPCRPAAFPAQLSHAQPQPPPPLTTSPRSRQSAAAFSAHRLPARGRLPPRGPTPTRPRANKITIFKYHFICYRQGVGYRQEDRHRPALLPASAPGQPPPHIVHYHQRPPICAAAAAAAAAAAIAAAASHITTAAARNSAGGRSSPRHVTIWPHSRRDDAHGFTHTPQSRVPAMQASSVCSRPTAKHTGSRTRTGLRCFYPAARIHSHGRAAAAGAAAAGSARGRLPAAST